jgi:hypothetical protein
MKSILDKLDQFQRVIDAATPGPWTLEVQRKMDGTRYWIKAGKDADGCDVDIARLSIYGEGQERDGTLIAQSRTFSDQQNRALRVAVEALEKVAEGHCREHVAITALTRIQAILNEGDGK